ncbi:14365_t:CDS:2, partial [Funneliformis geosporum]
QDLRHLESESRELLEQLLLKDLQRTESQEVAIYPSLYDDIITLEMKFFDSKMNILKSKVN